MSIISGITVQILTKTSCIIYFSFYLNTRDCVFTFIVSAVSLHKNINWLLLVYTDRKAAVMLPTLMELNPTHSKLESTILQQHCKIYLYLLHKSVESNIKNLGFKFACTEFNGHLTINSTGTAKPMINA